MNDTITISTEHIKRLVAPKHPSELHKWLPTLKQAISHGDTITFAGVEGSDVLVPSAIPALLVHGEFTRPTIKKVNPLQGGYYKGYQFKITGVEDEINVMWIAHEHCNLDMPRSFAWPKRKITDLPEFIDALHFGDVRLPQGEYEESVGPIRITLTPDRIISIITGHERLSCPLLSCLYIHTDKKKHSLDPRLMVSALLELGIIYGDHYEQFVKTKGKVLFFTNVDLLSRIEQIRFPENFTSECVKLAYNMFWQIYSVSETPHSTSRDGLMKWAIAELKKDKIVQLYNVLRNDYTNGIREILQLTCAHSSHKGFKEFVGDLVEGSYLLTFIDDIIKKLRKDDYAPYVPLSPQ